jgi:hypothetical protein
VASLKQAKTEITRPTEWREWDVSGAHRWLRSQLGLPTQRGQSSTFEFFRDLLRVWDAPRPEFWPTLTWDRHSRQISAQMDALSPSCPTSCARLRAHLSISSSGGRGARSLRRRPRLKGGRDRTFADGSRAAGSAACGNRIARLCGGAEGAAGRRCVGRIFKAVVAGLAAPVEQQLDKAA